MQRGRSQQLRRAESKPRNAAQKPKAHENKSKALGQTINPSKQNSSKYTIESPYFNKKQHSDKQNSDIFHTVLKIVAAAAESKEKDILLGLLALQQKERKIRGLANKQLANERQELQSMMAHLRQEQERLLCSLKIEIGKRKLHSLDDHDLKEDVLNLNSYVMRRTKKETIILKEQGADLFSEIYSKFDEQTRLINQSIKDKNHTLSHQVNGWKANKWSQEIESSSERVKTQLCNNSSKSEMMQKVIELERQNLRLIKEINKIEQEFECVVEEKLILEQKYQRVQKNNNGTRSHVRQQLLQLKNEVYEQKQSFFHCRTQICNLMKSYHLDLQSLILEQARACSREGEVCDLKATEEESGLMDEYQSILTQKQIEINNLLKTLAKLNTQKRNSQQQNQRLQQQVGVKQGKLGAIKNRLEGLPLLLTELSAQTQNQIKKLVQKYKDQYSLDMAAMCDKIKSFESLICRRAQARNKQYSQNLVTQLNQLKSNCSSLQCQNTRLREDLAQFQRREVDHQSEKEKLARVIAENEKTLLAETMKLEQANRKLQQIPGLEHQIRRIASEKQQIVQLMNEEREQQIKHMANKLQQMQDVLDTAMEQNKQCCRRFNQEVTRNKQLIDKLSQLEQLLKVREDSAREDRLNATLVCELHQLSRQQNQIIESNRRALQNKNEELQALRIQFQREQMKAQDFQSWALKECQTNKINQSKRRLALNKIQFGHIKRYQHQIEDMLRKFNSQFITSMIIIQENISLKCSVIQRNFYLGKRKQLKLDSHALDHKIQSRCLAERELEQIASALANLIRHPKTNLPVFLNFVGQKQYSGCAHAIISKVASLAELQQGKAQQVSEQQIGGQSSLLNQIEARSPNEGNQLPSNHSFLADEHILHSGFAAQDFSQMLNVSGFVDEVQSLRSELVESLKQNQLLTEELKLYQEKEIDKIFDF